MSLSLTSCCPICKTTSNLSRCQACKVVHYCSREHQTEHWAQHKRECNAVKKSQALFEKEDRRLRGFEGDWMTPAGPDLFENHAGRFWGLIETRDYMRARYAVADAISKIKTTKAVEASLDHIMELLRLCRSDNMGVRDVAPCLFLRLGKDQECYDFVKWWATADPDGRYDWGDTTLPYLNTKDADVFEPVSHFAGEYLDLSHSVAVTLIKIRLLLDVKSLQNSLQLGAKVPQEVFDNIRGQLVSTIVAGNKDIMDSNDQTELIKKLEGQVKTLYKAIDANNKYFWPALIKPGGNLTAPLSAYSQGSPEHMQIMLQYSYASWAETPGAIDAIKKMRK